MALEKICILGATGSIGVNTLRVIEQHPDRFSVHALSANSNIELLQQQCLRFRPAQAVTGSEDSARRLQGFLRGQGLATDVYWGREGLVDIAADPAVDIVMAAIVGGAGLPPTLAAVRAGKKVLLANKEALVMTGELFMQEAERSRATVLPIDSEHNAIFQCLPVDERGRFRQKNGNGISKIILTASGGPFRTWPREKLVSVSPAQACAHPNWDMGRKISVDSATLVNKALELIEACYLFSLPENRVEVLVHPQSIVHSMVYYSDGSVLAQLGNPDMRTPIAHALAWPERINPGVEPLDLARVGSLEFEEADTARFPGLALGRAAAASLAAAPIIFNAANEIAVASFLAGELGFTQIPVIIDRVLQRFAPPAPATLEEVLDTDARAREQARTAVVELGKKA